MKVGDYVRTKNNGIGKIISFSYQEEDECCFIELSNRRTGIKQFNIIKSSPNIIDLIEVGDYVNGIQITSIENDNKGKYVFGYGADGMEGEMWFYNNNIKSIVTKEQFSQMEYRIGE